MFPNLKFLTAEWMVLGNVSGTNREQSVVSGPQVWPGPARLSPVGLSRRGASPGRSGSAH